MTNLMRPGLDDPPVGQQFSRRQLLALLGAGTAGAAALAAGAARFAALAVPGADASSHREAPLISQDPVADNTDVYAFRSPDNPSTVTLIANFIPFEFPAGGPNFFKFGDDVLYEIHIDNDGDALPDLSYQFTFTTVVKNPNTFLYNTGPISSLTDPNWNVRQTMNVALVDRNGKSTPLGSGLPTPPVNIGPKSTPNYDALAAAAVSTLSNGARVFAGQRADPFFVDLGSLFDLLTIRQLPGNAGAGVNGLNGYNVHSIVLQAPITQLTANGSAPADPKDPNAVIGIWSTASRKSMSVLSTAGEAPTASGDWVQISRLGSPLVNEAVIPIGHKDLWNSSQPKDDGQFLKYVQDPEPSRLLNALYKIAVPPAPRDDLVAIFLTGIPNATMPPNVQPSEQLRLNVAVPVSATPNRMGVLGGDLQGYPNGRRLNDDVVDISLQALAGAAYPLFHAGFKADPLAGKLGDGVDGPSVLPLDIFPYVASPYQGYDFSGGVAAAPNITGVVGAPASGIAELGASASGTLTGSTGGAYTSYQISNPSGAAVKLTLTYTPVTAPLGKQIAIEVYQGGAELTGTTDSNSAGSFSATVTPSSSGGPALVKVANYVQGDTITYTLTRS